jgi:hypothetical protein
MSNSNKLANILNIFKHLNIKLSCFTQIKYCFWKSQNVEYSSVHLPSIPDSDNKRPAHHMMRESIIIKQYHCYLSIQCNNISVFTVDVGHSDHTLCRNFGNLGHMPYVSILRWDIHGSPHTEMMLQFQAFLEMSLVNQRKWTSEQMEVSCPTDWAVLHLHWVQSPARIKKQNTLFFRPTQQNLILGQYIYICLCA